MQWLYMFKWFVEFMLKMNSWSFIRAMNQKDEAKVSQKKIKTVRNMVTEFRAWVSSGRGSEVL